MKLFFTVSASVVLLASAAMAEGYGTAGCGLGSMLFGQDEGFVQIFAATTNSSSGNQTFAISSGTSNCDAEASFSMIKARDFIAGNRQQLETDVARGNGEALASLSNLVGCDSGRLSQSLQSNYENIFVKNSSEAAVNDAIIDHVVTTCS